MAKSTPASESTTMSINREVHKQMTLHCTKFGLQRKQWLEKLVTDYLAGNIVPRNGAAKS